jgi:putative transposase
MPKKRHSREQIVAILREAERTGNNEEVIRKHGLSDQTFYRWKRMYGGMGVSEIRRMKELEQENRKLKQLAGDQALAIELMKEELKKKDRD